MSYLELLRACFEIVAAEVTRLKYYPKPAVFGERNEPRYLGCYIARHQHPERMKITQSRPPTSRSVWSAASLFSGRRFSHSAGAPATGMACSRLSCGLLSNGRRPK